MSSRRVPPITPAATRASTSAEPITTAAALRSCALRRAAAFLPVLRGAGAFAFAVLPFPAVLALFTGRAGVFLRGCGFSGGLCVSPLRLSPEDFLLMSRIARVSPPAALRAVFFSSCGLADGAPRRSAAPDTRLAETIQSGVSSSAATMRCDGSAGFSSSGIGEIA